VEGRTGIVSKEEEARGGVTHVLLVAPNEQNKKGNTKSAYSAML
jgi:hypothetical protein